MTAADDIPALALAWHRAGRGAVLATVVDTWGSAPRPVGSQLLIDAAGAMEGSVSGGCVEGAVVSEAAEALADGRARLLDYGVSEDDAFAVGLACGGRIRVLVEPVGTVMPENLLAELVDLRAARQPAAYVVDLDGPDRRIDRDGHADRFRADKSGIESDGRRFIAVHNPPLRMVIVGGVHIAQTLVGMAQACGYDVTVVDPRTAFANAARFPDVALLDGWPDAVLAGLGLDRRTAVITLTHDPKLDDPALITALHSDAFYIGALGSTRTHAKRVERLRAAGFDAAQIARINAPVGLDIGARSPAEIAASIIAQVTQSLRR